MERRDFLCTVFAGAAALRASAGSAQPAAQMKRLGILSAADAVTAARLGQIPAFFDELHRLGWTEGRNIAIDVRNTGGKPELFQSYARELVTLQPDVIFGILDPGLKALLAATRTIPIVFALTNYPVTAGLSPACPIPAAT